MPYTKSSARSDYESVIKSLIKQSKFSSIRSNSVPHEIQQCVFKTAIFQASAVLEEYVRSLLDDWMYSLKNEGKTLSHIPNELVCFLRINRQSGSFRNYFIDNNEWKIIGNQKKDIDISLFYSDDTLVADVLKPAVVIGDLKYPSEKNMLKLFRRFGIEDIFKAVDKKGKKDYKKILKSFSDIRTEIAHTHPSKELTFNDVDKSLKKLSDFVVMIDRVACSHVVKISGSECWG